MTDAIQQRRQNQDYIRQIQQDKTEKKKQLAENMREEMKTLKENYQKENQKIDEETGAAVNHIQETMSEDYKKQQTEKVEMATYNRKMLMAQKAAEQKERSEQAHVKTSSVSTATNSSHKNGTSKVLEKQDSYVIETTVPQSEQDTVEMSVQDNKIILSGQRKSQDLAEDESQKIKTNNLQIFNEEFKLDHAINSNGISKITEGDTIRYFIPKLTPEIDQ